MPHISIVNSKKLHIGKWKISKPSIFDIGYSITLGATIMNPALGILSIPVLTSYIIDKIISKKTKRGKWLSKFLKRLAEKEEGVVKATYIPGYYYSVVLKHGIITVKFPINKNEIVVEVYHNKKKGRIKKLVIYPDEISPEKLADSIYRELEE